MFTVKLSSFQNLIMTSLKAALKSKYQGLTPNRIKFVIRLMILKQMQVPLVLQQHTIRRHQSVAHVRHLMILLQEGIMPNYHQGPMIVREQTDSHDNRILSLQLQ